MFRMGFHQLSRLFGQIDGQGVKCHVKVQGIGLFQFFENRFHLLRVLAFLDHAFVELPELLLEGQAIFVKMRLVDGSQRKVTEILKCNLAIRGRGVPLLHVLFMQIDNLLHQRIFPAQLLFQLQGVAGMVAA